MSESKETEVGTEVVYKLPDLPAIDIRDNKIYEMNYDLDKSNIVLTVDGVDGVDRVVKLSDYRHFVKDGYLHVFFKS